MHKCINTFYTSGILNILFYNLLAFDEEKVSMAQKKQHSQGSEAPGK